MAALTQDPPRSVETSAGVLVHLLTVEDVDKMVGAGILTEDSRVELLGGVLARKMTKYAPHSYTVAKLAKLLERLLGDGMAVWQEKAVDLGPRWRPEPDIAVADGPLDDYQAVMPQAEDLVMVVEVSESTYRVDRGVKWAGYAEAGVPEYWIVNLSERVIEVYSSPSGPGETTGYGRSTIYQPGDEVPVTIEGVRVGAIGVDDVLP